MPLASVAAHDSGALTRECNYICACLCVSIEPNLGHSATGVRQPQVSAGPQALQQQAHRHDPSRARLPAQALPAVRLKRPYRGTLDCTDCSLTDCRASSLYGNELNGTLPASFGGLTELNELSLSSCRLTGTIPPSWGGMSNLAYLDLTHNMLEGTIPAALGSLSSLGSLMLSRNRTCRVGALDAASRTPA